MKTPVGHTETTSFPVGFYRPPSGYTLSRAFSHCIAPSPRLASWPASQAPLPHRPTELGTRH